MDESAFRQRYREHTPVMFGLALRMCGSRSVAEELVQEAWVRALEKAATFQGSSKYRTWLTGILVNCFREHLRLTQKVPEAMDEDRLEAKVTRLHSAETFDPLDVERALSQLPLGYREVVILHDVNGHTHEEIALMLGVEVGSSKSQLSRGRARLRQLLVGAQPKGMRKQGDQS